MAVRFMRCWEQRTNLTAWILTYMPMLALRLTISLVHSFQ